MKKIRLWCKCNPLLTGITILTAAIVICIVPLQWGIPMEPETKVLMAFEQWQKDTEGAEGVLTVRAETKNLADSRTEQLMALIAAGTEAKISVKYNREQKMLLFDGGVFAAEKKLLPIEFYWDLADRQELCEKMKKQLSEVMKEVHFKERHKEKIYKDAGKLTMPVYGDSYVFEIDTKEDSGPYEAEFLIDKSGSLREIKIIIDYGTTKLTAKLKIDVIYKEGDAEELRTDGMRSLGEAMENLKALT